VEITRLLAVLLVCGIYTNHWGASSQTCLSLGLRQKDRRVFAVAE
jgi:hypothetical protein